MPNAGHVETRKAVAEYLSKHNRQAFSPDDIVMTVGAGGGLNVVFKTILNPGEEVIIPSPYFVEYNFYLDNHQGVTKPVSTRPDFTLDFEAIEKAISEKTKAVLINSPNNPTGKVYSKQDLDTLGNLLAAYSRKRGEPIYLISDEPYRKIVIWNHPQRVRAYGVLVTSFQGPFSPRQRISCRSSPVHFRQEVRMGGMITGSGVCSTPSLMQKASQTSGGSVVFYQKKRHALQWAGGLQVRVFKTGRRFLSFPKPYYEDVAFVLLQKRTSWRSPAVLRSRP
jgi:aspartate aminotransferase